MSIDNWLIKNEKKVDWKEIYSNWQDMQLFHNCWRDQQVHTIVKTVLALPFKKINVVDLCCGPGTLSKALLENNYRINIIAIDVNKFLLTVYKNILKKYNDRFKIIEGDITDFNIFTGFDEEIHAVISLTALHWLSKEKQKTLYKNIYKILVKDGIFINGDPIDIGTPFFKNIDFNIKNNKGVDWNTFWDRIYDRYDIKNEIEELNNEFTIFEGSDEGYTGDFYLTSLKEAGFKNSEILFLAGNRVVYGGIK